MKEEANAAPTQETEPAEKQPRYDFRFMLRDHHRDTISRLLNIEPSDAGEKVYMTVEVYGTEAQARNIAAQTANGESTEAILREALWSTAPEVNLDELMDEKLPEAAAEYSERTGMAHRVKDLTAIELPVMANLLDAAKYSSWERYGKDWAITLQGMADNSVSPDEVFEPTTDAD